MNNSKIDADSIPLSPNQVTPVWLESVLSRNHSNIVQVQDLQSINSKDGMLSSIFKAKVFMNGNEVNLFIKIMPSDENHKGFLEKFPLDATEIFTYEDLMPKLMDFEHSAFGTSNLKKIFCEYFGGKCSTDSKSRGFYLILEDIGDSYKMQDFYHGLNKEQIIKVMKSLANFHGISYCYRKLVGEIKCEPIFPKVLENPEDRKFLDYYLKLAISELKNINENDLAEKLQILSENYENKFKEAFEGPNKDFLAHGDLWVNNVMFNDSNEVS